MYILPQPVFIEEHEESFLLDYTTYLALDPGCSRRIYRQCCMLQGAIEKNTGYRLHLTRGSARWGDIRIGLCQEEERTGYYSLDIRADGVELLGSEESILYGIQTLIQILEQSGAVLPGAVIRDCPKLPFRGFYHDMTRGRVPHLSWLKKLADKMMRYKMNQLQLYVEHTYLFRDFSEIWRDDTPMTPEEILELDEYCYDRGIELIPSISTCSHLYKLLRSRQWQELCELDQPGQEPFTAWGKQVHHTIDISNEKSLELVKRMLEEYRPLFRTDKFNICADETFDLGRGKSEGYCREKGLGQAYVGYVKQLCEHVISMGCKPMMWGDVIEKYPRLLANLPKGTIFLNWAYHDTVTEEPTKVFADQDVEFYNCPGVSGWSRMCNDYAIAYENIRRMAEYAKANRGIGLLNTDWGDYYHTSHPEFSIPGMIYGAQFSWGNTVERGELNQAVSVLEYGVSGKNLPEILCGIEENNLYSWMNLCIFKENGFDEGLLAETLEKEFRDEQKLSRVGQSEESLRKIKTELSRAMSESLPESRKVLGAYIVTVDGCRYLNKLGAVITRRECMNEKTDPEADRQLAASLERWFYHYKQVWRSVSQESELGRIQIIMDWYCDYLRSEAAAAAERN